MHTESVQEATWGFSFLQFMHHLPLWVSPLSRHFLWHKKVLFISRQHDEHLVNVPYYLLNLYMFYQHKACNIFSAFCGVLLLFSSHVWSVFQLCVLPFLWLLRVLQLISEIFSRLPLYFRCNSIWYSSFIMFCSHKHGLQMKASIMLRMCWWERC